MDRVSLFEMEVLQIMRDTMNRYTENNKNVKNPECVNITSLIDNDLIEA